MNSRRLKVLLIAESCNPKMISVPLVGFSQAQAIRELADAHVVTHWRNAQDLASAGWREGRDFTTIDAEKPAKLAWWLGEKIAGRGKGWTLQTALFVPTYYYFEHLVWKTFGARLRAAEVHGVHLGFAHVGLGTADRLVQPAAGGVARVGARHHDEVGV